MLLPSSLSLRCSAVAAIVAAMSSASVAGTVTVITSFPKELTAAYKAAFEKANPDVKLEILNKSTIAGIAFVRETAVGQRPDVFWASAPDAFEVLKRDKLLVAAPEVDNKAIPAKIGNYPINDPQGYYKGQALAGYGIMYNTRYLKANKLNAPKEWDELLAREWFGHVAMTAPSRSGTMHLTVETILQGEGWDRGWAKVLQMAGNSAQITERSMASRTASTTGISCRPSYRLLRPRRQVLGLSGRLRLPDDDLDRAGQHRVDRRFQELG